MLAVLALCHGCLSARLSPPPWSLYRPVTLTGVITGLPVVTDYGVRVIFNSSGHRVVLVWPRGRSAPAPATLEPGQCWRLVATLKPAHGYGNPGVFDYGHWLYQQGIYYTGTVQVRQPARYLGKAGWQALPDQVRYALNGRLTAAAGSLRSYGLLKALLLGERDALPTEQKHLFQRTGTAHLIAISGLHVGLIFMGSYILLRGIVSAMPGFCRLFPAMIPAQLGGLLMALAYSLLAGFGTATQRALLMLLLAVGARLCVYPLRPRQIIILAGIVVGLWWPPSVTSAAFWLSFGAVGFLLYGLSARLGPLPRWQWGWYPQWLVTVAMLPLTALWFGWITPAALLANLLAIPLVTLLIVPALFGSLALLMLFGLNSFAVPEVAASGLFAMLGWLDDALPPYVLSQGVSFGVFLAALLGVIVWFAPRGFYLGMPALVLTLPLLYQDTRLPGPLVMRLSVLDVGQGLAVVIQTADQVWVYDTGGHFFGGGDAAERVLVPFLKYRGIKAIDTVMISHADDDHRGGLATLLAAFPVKQVISSYPEALAGKWGRHIAFRRCQAGQHFQASGLHLEVLHPPLQQRLSRNDQSCVLKITTAEGLRVLLPGDIEYQAESLLVAHQADRLKAEVLVAPHHGSNTSSSEGWVKAVAPGLVLYPAGFANRYGFPKPGVIRRYHSQGASQYSTAECGALEVELTGTVRLRPYHARCREIGVNRPA